MYMSEDDLKRLQELCEEPSYTVPQGLSREERKELAEMVASEDNTIYLGDDAWG